MKARLTLFLLAALAALVPGRGTDVGELIPVELVCVTTRQGNYLASTDTGNVGSGKTLGEAMDDLRQGAPGEIFLETADYLLLSEDTKASWDQLEQWFRPGSLVYGVGDRIDAAQAAQYLRSHTGGVPLNRLEESSTLERVIQTEGDTKIEK